MFEILIGENEIIYAECYRVDDRTWFHFYINGQFLHQEFVKEIISIEKKEDLVEYLLSNSKAIRDLSAWQLKQLEKEE